MPQGILPYFTDTVADGTAAAWFARSFGATLTGLAYGGFAEPDSKTVGKMMAVGMIATLPNIAMAGMDTGGAFKVDLPFAPVNIWMAQLPVHAVLSALIANAAFGGDDKAKSK